MAKKGDRVSKEPLAIRMYAEQRSLKEIAAVLDVSETSLRKWKAESRRPGDELDAWDRARQFKCSRLDGLRQMFDETFAAMQELKPLQRLDSKMMDALAKLGALIEKWEGMEERARKAALTSAAAVVGEEARAQGMDEAQAEFWMKKVLTVA